MVKEKKLNRQQFAAIKYSQGPLLIVAGAGTGKTTVITHRIRHLITSGLARPQEILAVTFTEKAAAEMESRLDELLPYGVTQTTVATFHGVCDRILRAAGFHAGLPQNYTLSSPPEVLGLVKSHLYDFNLDYFRPLSVPDKFLYHLLEHTDRLRDEDISPAEYSRWVSTLPHRSETDRLEKQKYSELASFYSQFQELKLSQNIFDFSDLIFYALHLFRARPNILSTYHQRWPWILVDEYQDTNFAQSQLVKLLAGDHPNLTVVADDDQAIYRWRGAATSNVLHFTHDFPHTHRIVLTKNFRSLQSILDRAYSLIRHNDPDRLEVQIGIDKKLTSSRSGGSRQAVKHLHFLNSEAEADGVVSQIVRLKKSHPRLNWADFAILVRANAHATPFLKSLFRSGIPHQFLGPTRLFDRPEIRDLVAYLRLLLDPSDESALFRVLGSLWSAIPPTHLALLISSSRKQKRPLAEVIIDDHQSQVKKLSTIINTHRQQLSTHTAGELLYDLLDRTRWLSHLTHYTSLKEEEIATNIIRFFNKLKSYEYSHPELTVSLALDWIELSTQTGDSPLAAEIDFAAENAVNLLTVHSAKGLEFDTVFLPCLVTQRFPAIDRSEALPLPDSLIKESFPKDDAHIQEERRLFYVGMTRARNRLYLTSADYYGEARRIKKPSPFIAEALGSISPSLSLSSSFSPPPPALVSTPLPPSPPPINYLDYTRVQTFRDCPLHYHAKYLLHLSSPPTAASTFGNVIHKTLKDYFENLKYGQPVDIVKLLDANWDPKGYENARRRQLYYRKGVSVLTAYVASLGPHPLLPERLEEPFKFALTPHLTLGGKMDRVNLLSDGQLEIVDYKTSSASNQLDSKAAAKDLQLSIYALAATHLDYPPFNRSPSQIVLTLYYLETQTAVSTTRTTAQLEAAISEIQRVKSDIEASDFSCSQAYICRQGKCDYQLLCRTTN